MSKNLKRIIFSLIFLAVLGGVAAVLLLTAPPKEDEGSSGEELSSHEFEDKSLVLSEREASDVLKLEITNADGSYEITPSGEEWTIAEIASAPLNTSDLTKAVENAAGFDAKEFAEEVASADDLKKYGLDAPKATVKATFSDNSVFTFKLGNDVPNTTTAVYMTADDRKVYTCYKSRTDCYTYDKFGYVSLDAMPEYDQSTGEEVEKLTIERADLEKPLIVENIKPDDEDTIQVYAYRLVSPYTAYADLQDAPNFMYSIFGMKADKALWVGLEDKDLKASGLDEPTCKLTVETNKKTYTLTLGRPIAETHEDENGNEITKIIGYFGVSSEVPDVLYQFSGDDITALSIKPEQIISRLFLMPYIYSLESINYSDSEGSEFTIGVTPLEKKSEDDSTEYKLSLNGADFDEQHIKDMYQYIISASGEELYLDEDKGKLLAEVRYVYADKSDGVNGEDVVRFYESLTDRKVVVNLNGSNILKTKQIYLTQLLSNAKSFLSGGEIILSY